MGFSSFLLVIIGGYIGCDGFLFGRNIKMLSISKNKIPMEIQK
jgi:hypothetical protein